MHWGRVLFHSLVWTTYSASSTASLDVGSQPLNAAAPSSSAPPSLPVLPSAGPLSPALLSIALLVAVPPSASPAAPSWDMPASLAPVDASRSAASGPDASGGSGGGAGHAHGV